jgi:rsbT co-antagonist protein RsbR
MPDSLDPCSLGTLEALHLKVVEASPDAKIVINEKGEIVIFNAQAELLFGYDRTEVIGQEIEILLPESLKDTHREHRTHYFTEPKTREMGIGLELKGRHRSGQEFPVQIKLAPIIVPKAGVHTLAVVRRVPKEKKEE